MDLARRFETGFVYVRNRYLDPDLGQFITPDPLGYIDGPSAYAIALNNPFDFTDPTGETAVVLWYGRGSSFGSGEGFDDLSEKLMDAAKQRGHEYRLFSIEFNGEPYMQRTSPGYSNSPDDLTIYTASAGRNPSEAFETLVRVVSKHRARGEKIFLVGHSMGAVNQETLANMLHKRNIEVFGLVAVDRYGEYSAFLTKLRSNVRNFLGFYSSPTPEVEALRESEGSRHFPGSGATKFRLSETTVNYGVLPVNETHQSIDSSPLVHRFVETLIFDTVNLLPLKLMTYSTGLGDSALEAPPSEAWSPGQ